MGVTVVLEDNAARIKRFRSHIPSADIFTTSKETIAVLEGDESIDALFLDHDLGQETYVDSCRHDCGMEVVRWLVAHPKRPIGQIIIHSCNRPAGDVMEDCLRGSGFNVLRMPFSQFTW